MSKVRKINWVELLILFILILFLIYYFFATDLFIYFFPESFPREFGETRSVDWEWLYKKNNYSLSATLPSTYNDYYNKLRKEYYCFLGFCPENWEELYLKRFLNIPAEDSTINKLALRFQELVRRDDLDDDELAELVLTFVQTIPYDWEKASSNLIKPEYPYEVLYDNKAICSGKTFLTVSLWRELGFGSALFYFKEEQHLAPAIKCPQEYSSYNSGFCFAEATTIGHRIGEIPRRAEDSPIPSANYLMAVYNNPEDGLPYSSPDIYPINDGRIYRGVLRNLEKLSLLNNLENQLLSKEAHLSYQKEELKRKKELWQKLAGQVSETYQLYLNSQELADYKYYRYLYDLYFDAHEEQISLTSGYNLKVNEYNDLINEIRKLIEEIN